MCRKYTIYEGFLLSQAVSIGNAVSALKDTVPGDFSAMNLSEICELIQEHKSNNGDETLNIRKEEQI